ncbi:hypothetical protein [Rossellomorea aquimaris]|uniref:hypothetical protein n=1 Tax=Rossellomorea aquimaris TaxID=189382 RepID=UPI0016536844|nr:hypothetical protein [Rossellomorea aquimaris]
MSRWRNLNQLTFDYLDTFYPLYEGGVQLGCVVLVESQYIRSIGKFREDLFLK